MACAKPIGGEHGATKCTPGEEGQPFGIKVYSALDLEKELALLPLWTPSESGNFIVRSFVAKNFVAAMAFFNAAAAVAEQQGHHPDFHLTQYRNVEIRLQTFSMGGVTQSDIEEAKLFDQLPVDYSPKWLKEHPEVATAPSTPLSSVTAS